jgi:hypothetical protein
MNTVCYYDMWRSRGDTDKLSLDMTPLTWVRAINIWTDAITRNVMLFLSQCQSTTPRLRRGITEQGQGSPSKTRNNQVRRAPLTIMSRDNLSVYPLATEITLHCVLLHLFRYLWLEPTSVVLDLWSEVTFVYVSNLCDRDILIYRASVKFQKQSGEISYWWCEVTEECYTSACLS